MSLCLVSADTWGLGPQQLETILFDERNHYYGPGNIISSILLLMCRPSGEVYQEVTEELTKIQGTSGSAIIPAITCLAKSSLLATET